MDDHVVPEAPNFSGNYPGQGVMIGPAWRRAWLALMAEPAGWALRTDLIRVMREEVPDMTLKTAANLLQSAVRADVLERWPKRAHPKNPVRYRPTQRYRPPESARIVEVDGHPIADYGVTVVNLDA